MATAKADFDFGYEEHYSAFLDAVSSSDDDESVVIVVECNHRPSPFIDGADPSRPEKIKEFARRTVALIRERIAPEDLQRLRREVGLED